jgi:rod shape-determining protein MreD
MSYPILIGIGVVLVVLDVGLGGLLSIAGIKPSLVLPFVVYIGLQRGPIEGTLFGAGVGLCCDCLGSMPVGSTMFSYSVIGFATGKLWNGGPFRVFWPWGVSLVLATVFSEAVTHYILSRGMNVDFLPIFIMNGLTTAFYTTVIGLLWFLSPLHRMQSA